VGEGLTSSESQAVELVGCRQNFSSGATKLPLLDHVHGLDAGEQLPRTPERLEAQHRIRDPFHSPVVLLHDVVEILRLAQFNVQAGVCIDTVDGRRVGTPLLSTVIFSGRPSRLMTRSR
jgi:hypothetical protein